MPKISINDRNRIIVLHEEGYSQVNIAKCVNCSRASVQKVVKKYNKTGDLVDKKKSVRPKKLSLRDEQFLKITALRNRKKVSAKLVQDLKRASGTLVHVSTVRRCLMKSGLKGCVAIKKPLLRKGNKEKRLKFAREHKEWQKNQWDKVLFTDESKIQILGTNRHQYIRRRKGEAMKEPCLASTIKHGGGNIQVWECISIKGVGDIVKITEKLTGEKYKNILHNHTVPSGRQLIGDYFILQQNNDPKHTCKLVKNYLSNLEEEGVLQTMPWPSQSPYLNIIEHVWDYLDRKKMKTLPKNVNELWGVLKEEWYNIPSTFIENLYKSISKRLQDVIVYKGGHT